MPDDDNDDVDFDEAVATAVSAALKKQTDDAERARTRKKEPKDFGEFSDRIKDVVKDAFAEMIAERDAPADDNTDDPPTRKTRSKSGFAAWWNGHDDDA